MDNAVREEEEEVKNSIKSACLQQLSELSKICNCKLEASFAVCEDQALARSLVGGVSDDFPGLICAAVYRKA